LKWVDLRGNGVGPRWGEVNKLPVMTGGIPAFLKRGGVRGGEKGGLGWVSGVGAREREQRK